ncbi:hypothetical protein AB0Y39_09150 [Weissella paramesenteroides]|uniref:hypothetical protein n=1 Tax=Weissella paramesenteroides TaxID=1249 RepID=UPI003F210EEB
MKFKEYVTILMGKVKLYWLKLTFKTKVIILMSISLAIILVSIGFVIKSHINNQNLSPQMKRFKRDGTMFMLIPEEVNENENHVVKIKGNTIPQADIRIGYGIFGDTTTADKHGDFTLVYDDDLSEKTNIKITANIHGKSIARIVTVLPSPQVLKEIENNNKQIKEYEQEYQKVKKLKLKGKSYIDAKREISEISSNIDVKSQSNNSEIKEVSESERVTDITSNQDENGVSVMLSLEPSDEAKRDLAAKKALIKEEKDKAIAKEKYLNNLEAYEVPFQEYAIEYLIDKNTSTIYERTTDDASISQSKFTGDMDSKIEFNLDGLQMIAYHHYAGNKAVAFFNDATGNSNEAHSMNPETVRDQYFQKVNLTY